MGLEIRARADGDLAGFEEWLCQRRLASERAVGHFSKGGRGTRSELPDEGRAERRDGGEVGGRPEARDLRDRGEQGARPKLAGGVPAALEVMIHAAMLDEMRRILRLRHYAGSTVRASKGDKDRVTFLPRRLAQALKEHLAKAKATHDRDLGDGAGKAPLPDALVRKYPNAGREWGWQFVFPSTRLQVEDPGKVRRWHVAAAAVRSWSTVQRPCSAVEKNSCVAWVKASGSRSPSLRSST